MGGASAIVQSDAGVWRRFSRLRVLQGLARSGGGNTYNSLWAAAVAAGAPTTSPVPMNSQVHAGYFDRTVTASLTTIDAPSYEMAAIKFGRDWATATVGTTVMLPRSLVGLAAFTAQTGQTGFTSYGGHVGINNMIN